VNSSQCTVFITGGASGLGAAVVRRFHAAGAQIMIFDTDSDRAAALIASLTGGGEAGRARLRAVAGDATDPAHVARAIEVTRTAFGALHVNINCAGIDMAMRTLTKNTPHPLDMFESVLRVNTLGTFNTLRLAAQAMADNTPTADGERGVIINAASMAAFEGASGQAAYAASKGAIVSMTGPIARDLAPYGVRVCAVAARGFAADAAGERGRPGQSARGDDFARLALHIVETPGLTGEVVRADGDMPPASEG
jgi:NAD(P)-dependent dehydrogenase (short-subunit alcohol dehydrogenase family)